MRVNKTELQLESLISRIQKKDLDLQPDFQRGEIWDKARRQRLIDSLLRDWYVPAVHVVQLPDGRAVVLDGQQRLAAIRDFFDDNFVVDGNIEPQSDEIRGLHGLKFSQLPPATVRALNRFSLQIIELESDDPREPNELFFRLNQAYSLTPPEKRNALHGPARRQVRELVEELVSTGLLSKETIGFTNNRLAYDDVISRTCVAIESNSLRRHINNGVVEEYYRSDGFKPETIEGVRSAGAIVARLLSNAPNRVRFNKGTLQTWLTYAYWAPCATGAVPDGLLGSFESDRAQVRQGIAEGGSLANRRVLDLVAVYDDRAAYRVTDVSSVVIRDLAIHVYSQLRYGTAPVQGSDELAAQIRRHREVEVQTLLTEFQERTRWGDSLGSRNA